MMENVEPNYEAQEEDIQPPIYVPPVPNVDVPPEDPDPLVTSVFMKVSRAIDGDSHYKDRISMALEITGYPNTRANMVHITNKVAGSIICRQSGFVDTSKVTDEQITEAMNTIPNPTY